MNDMSGVIIPKSDQINAEDFIAGPRTFTIEAVAISPGTEQPVSIKLAGEQRVFRPCKSMSRVLVGGWGPDANAYTGRSLTLYRDPKVKWGGLEVGGIRISHMSHIDRDMVMSLTATKGKRAPHQVKVLQGQQQTQRQTDPNAAEKWAVDHIAFVVGSVDLDRLASVQQSGKKAMDKLANSNPELHKRVSDAYAKRFDELSGADASDADPFEPATGRSDAQHGDQFPGDGDAEQEPS